MKVHVLVGGVICRSLYSESVLCDKTQYLHVVTKVGGGGGPKIITTAEIKAISSLKLTGNEGWVS